MAGVDLAERYRARHPWMLVTRTPEHRRWAGGGSELLLENGNVLLLENGDLLEVG